MKLKIAVAGSNQRNAEEVLDAMRLILGNIVCGASLVCTQEITDPLTADLFVCATTQADALALRVPQDRRIVLDLQPTSQFYVEVARIPAGARVVIFNSNSRYPQRLTESCRRLGIDHLQYEILAYEEMETAEIKKMLQRADYIIGIDRQVNEDVLLSAAYCAYLRPDVHIIGIRRVASMQSACMLIQWVASFLHQSVAAQVSGITSRLRSTVIHGNAGSGSHDLAGVANELDLLLKESNRSVLTMHDAVMKSFANQIAPHLTVIDPERLVPARESNGQEARQEIVQTLENINALSEKCFQLSHLPVKK